MTTILEPRPRPLSWIALPERLRLVPQLDESPWCVKVAQLPIGKLALLAVFAVGLRVHHMPQWLELSAALAVISAFPKRRAILLALTTACFAVLDPSWLHLASLPGLRGLSPDVRSIARSGWVQGATVLVVLAALGTMVAYVHRRPKSWLARHALLSLIGVAIALLVAASAARGHGLLSVILFALALIVGVYLRFVGFALISPPIRSMRDALLHIAMLHPMWNSGGLNPVPQGGAELARIESASSEELAITQLKGLKLVVWAGMLLAIEWVLRFVLFGELPRAVATRLGLGPMVPLVPRLEDALAHSVAGAPYVWYIGWASVIATFSIHVIEVARGSHLVIGVIRMAGFRALRGAVRPFAATSFADFWGRYSFYFKELLARFFFVPTYRRWFRAHPRLRIAAATFAAAGIGNYVFHVMVYAFNSVPAIDTNGLWALLRPTAPTLVYTLVLSAGIAASHLYTMNRPKLEELPLWRRGLTSARIIVLYALIWVLPSPAASNYALVEYLRFYRSLF
jgi:hypothetical protein